MIRSNARSSIFRADEFLTLAVGAGVLIAAGSGLFIPGFYDGFVDPEYLTGTITADLMSLICLPILAICMVQARRDSLVARLAWPSLLIYLAYTYATYAFDRIYTPLFPLYLLIFGASCFAAGISLAGLDIPRLAKTLENMRLRRTTAVYLVFTGLVLYAIEAPIILSRIPNGAARGGTPFMVLDLSIVAPMAALTGVWLWQRRPWGFALAGVFLIKAVTLMTGFLLADYYNWFTGNLADPIPTVAFTVVNLLAYGFVWNTFASLQKTAHAWVGNAFEIM
jgi:hypothetical protein